MNVKITSRAATFTGLLAFLAVSLDAVLPHWIAFTRMLVLPAYGCVVALARTMAADLQAMFGNLIILPAELALKGELFFVPSASLFTIGSVATRDRTKLFLSPGEDGSAGAFHAPIIPIGAA